MCLEKLLYNVVYRHQKLQVKSKNAVCHRGWHNRQGQGNQVPRDIGAIEVTYYYYYDGGMVSNWKSVLMNGVQTRIMLSGPGMLFLNFFIYIVWYMT